MLNVGIIACGKIAQVRHIPEYRNNPEARIVGYFDLDEKRAAQMAERFGGRVYGSAEELLADPAIDAVSVCAANAFHAELSIQALRAGKHVLCEKPMAIRYEDCEAMAGVARATGKRLLIGQNQRFAKAHVTARQLLRDGEIGRVLSFRSTFGHSGPETWSITPGAATWFFDKKLAAMGAMADLGIHKTDLLRYLLDQDVIRVSAKLSTLDKRGPDSKLIAVDDNALCIYEMSGGTIGTMTASWTYYGAEDNSTVLYGTKGIMRIYDDPAHSIVILYRDGRRRELDLEAIQTNDKQSASGVIDEFVSAVCSGRPSILDADDIIRSMRAVFAALRSAEEGRTVETLV